MSIYDQEVLKVLLSPTYPPRIKIKVIQIIRKPKEAFDNHKLFRTVYPTPNPHKNKNANQGPRRFEVDFKMVLVI